jgi:hypothetical protein
VAGDDGECSCRVCAERVCRGNEYQSHQAFVYSACSLAIVYPVRLRSNQISSVINTRKHITCLCTESSQS